MDLRCGHFSVKMYAKKKELGPIGGVVCRARPPLDPPMRMVLFLFQKEILIPDFAIPGIKVLEAVIITAVFNCTTSVYLQWK